MYIILLAYYADVERNNRFQFLYHIDLHNKPFTVMVSLLKTGTSKSYVEVNYVFTSSLLSTR